MAKKLMAWKTKGMNKDLSVSAFNPEFAFDNRNLRLSTNEGNTYLSWVNEKGTAAIGLVKDDLYWENKLTHAKVYEEPENASEQTRLWQYTGGSNPHWTNVNTGEVVYTDPHDTSTTPLWKVANIPTTIEGTPIGQAIINSQLVVFTTDNHSEGIRTEGYIDNIYLLKYSDKEGNVMLCNVLYNGNLNFSTRHPLETIVSYESDTVQKVYWTDGRNQPRVINIAGNLDNVPPTYFNFVPTLQLEETVMVQKELSASGMFAPGVIQYSLTYYNKYGQESNIFYTSPLLYISYKDRGGSPEDKIENAFRIVIKNPDTHFDFLRIYSIHRTSINGTPFCKRVQDISLKGVASDATVSYIDTGVSGDSIDPTELLYKGGETITAETMEQKDNTVFFGNISVSRPSIAALNMTVSINIDRNICRKFQPTLVSSGSYTYYNQLTSVALDSKGNSTGRTVPCGGFKTGETYRLGVQFQHETGKWSEPVFIGDYEVEGRFAEESKGGVIQAPIFGGLVSNTTLLSEAGYKKVRPLVVFPKMIDRTIICQGVAAPTLYTQKNRNDGSVYSQSSWFFRPYTLESTDNTEAELTGASMPKGARGKSLRYTRNITETTAGETIYNPRYIRQAEIEGQYKQDNQFVVDGVFRTLHSPDVEFDDQLSLMDFTKTKYQQVGAALFKSTMSDMDIQTETPVIGTGASGFIHNAYTGVGARGLASGLFYEDYVVDDDKDEDKFYIYKGNEFNKYTNLWMTYLWQGTGSLNNDINRPANAGTSSAKLKKKVVSNLRYAEWYEYGRTGKLDFEVTPQVFSGEDYSILKFNYRSLNCIYKGNIDTSLVPDDVEGKYFYRKEGSNALWWKTWNRGGANQDGNGLLYWSGNKWNYQGNDIGDRFIDLNVKKNPVRMKYKSTSHLFIGVPESGINEWDNSSGLLPILEITQEPMQRFGGESPDALRENIWIPCGEPVPLGSYIYWEYGDTYFQRYDCLKTYPFTREDLNQVVEIGSFMLETHMNIDGRYDRNRGLSNNLNISPQNFNLMNPVYNQQDNFFTYRIMDKDDYVNTNYPNQVTWSKTKENGADVDLWTNVTLASVLELDGDKGKVNSINRLNDQLIAFQDTGIAQILYNENTQISTTNGVPIEIANSGKVQGKRYLSNTVGCSNKWSIATTPAGIYFIDSNDKSIYLFSGQLTNISQQGGFNPWAKNHIPSSSTVWNPDWFGNFVTYYDRMNQDVLFINDNTALAWSEKLGAFTSFYDYGNVPYFCNLEDTGVWITKNGKVWKHQDGDYCRFFGTVKPYSMVLIGNPEPQTDKIFTNLEFRACVDGDGTTKTETIGGQQKEVFDKFYLPFDTLETWNEYQHGIAHLQNKNGHSAMIHFASDKTASLKRKFRIWRCDIPRNNASDVDVFTEVFDYTFHFAKGSNTQRMRNTWLYLNLTKEAEEATHRTEIHDLIMTYFN